MCHGVCDEVRGQHAAVISLGACLCAFQESNSDLQDCMESTCPLNHLTSTSYSLSLFQVREQDTGSAELLDNATHQARSIPKRGFEHMQPNPASMPLSAP